VGVFACAQAFPAQKKHSVALAHYFVAWLRTRSSRIARLFDGTPLILLENNAWRSNTLKMMGIEDDDIMSSARSRDFNAGSDPTRRPRTQWPDQHHQERRRGE
jgi:hypothetical protein